MASERALASDSLTRKAPGRMHAVRAPLRPLLTIEQVAEFLSVSPRTVRRLMARGFPHVRFGRLLRFDQADVLRWVAGRRSEL